MSSRFISISKYFYKATPSMTLRKLYYKIFQHLVKNKILRKKIDGATFELDLSEKIDLALFLSQFETDLVEAIERFCKPGFTILDIGANVGAHALRFGKIVGDQGHVYTFEPTEYAFKKLKKNVALNPDLNISCNQIALSDTNAPGTEINFRSSWCTNGGRKDYSCKVDFIQLDDWLKENQTGGVDIIKLDVDGNEYSVLKGAETFLKNNKPLIYLEVWGPNFKNKDKNPFIFLQEYGYKFYSLDMKQEYKSIETLKNMVSSEQGELLDLSFNMIATCQA